LEGEIDRGLEW